MFSGKTLELLRQVSRFRAADKKVMIFRPHIDSRSVRVKSRLGPEADAYTVDAAIQVNEIAETLNADVVAVDEAQFFDDELPWILDHLANFGKTVIVSGLDKDFMGRGFGPMPALLSMDDNITMLSAVCTICKEDASRTQRLVNGRPATPDDPLVVLGGMDDDKYEPRCREHHQI